MKNTTHNSTAPNLKSTVLCTVFSIESLIWTGGRERFMTPCKKFKIENYVEGFEKGFQFIKTTPDDYVITDSSFGKPLFRSSKLQKCIDFLNCT
jgi:hypothetical protein